MPYLRGQEPSFSYHSCSVIMPSHIEVDDLDSPPALCMLDSDPTGLANVNPARAECKRVFSSTRGLSLRKGTASVGTGAPTILLADQNRPVVPSWLVCSLLTGPACCSSYVRIHFSV